MSFIADFNDNVPKLTFVPGINDKVTLSKFEFVRGADGSSNFVQLEFSREGGTLNDRVYEPTKVYPREKFSYKGGNKTSEGMESEAEAWARTWGDINSKVKHIATNYVTEEEFMNRFRAVQPKSFEDLVNLCTLILPKNFVELEGQLIVGYNNKGYLSVPRSMRVTGNFFSIQNNKPLNVSDRVALERPEQENDSTQEQNTTNSSSPASWTV